MALVCHVVLQDHVTTLSSLVVICIAVVEVSCFSGWRARFHRLLLKSTITVYLHLKHMSWNHMAYHVQYMSHTPRATINETFENCWLVRPTTSTKRKEKEKEKTMAIAKLFTLEARVIIMMAIIELEYHKKISSVENNLFFYPIYTNWQKPKETKKSKLEVIL